MDVWQIISYISSIVTLLLFITYLIGHIWKIKQIKNTLSEQYKFESDFDDENPPLDNYFDLSGGVGQVFSVCSPNGFKQIIFYETKYNDKNELIKGNLSHSITNIGPNEKVYAKINVPDTCEGCFVEIIKNDGIKISFGIADSGYDGSLVKTKYKFKMTLKSWIYYLCD